MCLTNFKKTYSRREYAWKVVLKKYGYYWTPIQQSGRYFKHITNNSSRYSTRITSEEAEKGEIKRGFHFFCTEKDIKKFFENADLGLYPDHVAWKVRVDRKDEVAHGKCKLYFRGHDMVLFESCVYTKFDFVEEFEPSFFLG